MRTAGAAARRGLAPALAASCHWQLASDSYCDSLALAVNRRRAVAHWHRQGATVHESRVRVRVVALALRVTVTVTVRVTGTVTPASHGPSPTQSESD